MSQAQMDTSRQSGDIVMCKAANDAPVRKIIMAVLLLGVSAWTAYDAYVAGKYPYASDLSGWCSWTFNHFLFVVLVPIGITVLVQAIALKRRTLVADAAGIGYLGQEQIKWGDIQALDATRLASKGLLTIQHGPPQDPQTWELDSYYFQDFKPLVAFIEQRVHADRIRR